VADRFDAMAWRLFNAIDSKDLGNGYQGVPLIATALRAEREAGFAAGQEAMREKGWKLVPREPTPEMEIRGGIARDFDQVGKSTRTRAAEGWRTMYDAAPEPPR